MKRIKLAALLLLTCGAAFGQAVFRCPDANGRIHYSDQRCADNERASPIKLSQNTIDSSLKRRQLDERRFMDEQEQEEEPRGSRQRRAEPAPHKDYAARLQERNDSMRAQTDRNPQSQATRREQEYRTHSGVDGQSDGYAERLQKRNNAVRSQVKGNY